MCIVVLSLSWNTYTLTYWPHSSLRFIRATQYFHFKSVFLYFIGVTTVTVCWVLNDDMTQMTQSTKAASAAALLMCCSHCASCIRPSQCLMSKCAELQSQHNKIIINKKKHISVNVHVVTHQVDSVSFVCVSQLPRDKGLPFLSVLCLELCVKHT